LCKQRPDYHSNLQQLVGDLLTISNFAFCPEHPINLFADVRKIASEFPAQAVPVSVDLYTQDKTFSSVAIP